MRRRDFLLSAGAGLGAYALLPALDLAWASVPSRFGKIIEGRKLNIACVGIGGQGKTNIRGLSSENIAALCDVYMAEEQRQMAASYPDARLYRDFRGMLIEMDEQIDAVVVSTPDHMHFPIAAMAMQMGKHVYVEKPIAHTVEEARRLMELAREKNVVTQCGNQGHAKEGTRNLVEWIRAGAIGAVREVHVWTNRPLTDGYWKWYQGVDRPETAEPVPENLDWNLWQGVAERRPFNSRYLPRRWRGWWDFGCCALGDMGCHLLDAPFWALDLKYPESVEVDQNGATADSGPVESTITYTFPARGDMPPVKVLWYDGGRKPPRPEGLESGRELDKGGFYMVGDKGTILSSGDYCQSPRLIPESAMQAFAPNRPDKVIPRIPGGDPRQEWVRACKGEGPAPGSNFDYSGPLSEMVLMGNLAARTNRRVEWDGPNMRCTNLPEANELVGKKYRVF